MLDSRTLWGRITGRAPGGSLTAGRVMTGQEAGFEWVSGDPRVRAGAPTLILAIKRSWAEVDAALPVAWQLRRQHPDWRVLAILQDRELHTTRERFPALFGILCDTADAVAVPVHRLGSGYKRRKSRHDGRRESALRHAIRDLATRWRLRGIARRETRALVDAGVLDGESLVLLRNHKPGTPLEQGLLNAAPRMRAVSLHHGAHPVAPAGQRALPDAPGRGPRADVFLAKTADEAGLLRFPGDTAIAVVGTPKYDPAWMQHLAARADAGGEAARVEAFLRGRQAWLFLTRGPDNSVMDEGDYGELLQALRGVLGRRENVALLVKPHPREDLAALRSTLPGAEGDNWLITGLAPYAAAQRVELTIAMWSSVILDAAAAGTPVIELYRFRRPNRYLARLAEPARLGSTHAALDLCVPTADEAELEAAVEAWEQSGWLAPEWQRRQRGVRALMGGVPGDVLGRAVTAMTAGHDASARTGRHSA